MEPRLTEDKEKRDIRNSFTQQTLRLRRTFKNSKSFINIENAVTINDRTLNNEMRCETYGN